jgi:hypothetical protein
MKGTQSRIEIVRNDGSRYSQSRAWNSSHRLLSGRILTQTQNYQHTESDVSHH